MAKHCLNDYGSCGWLLPHCIDVTSFVHLYIVGTYIHTSFVCESRKARDKSRN